ncbi:MAG TPA: transcriptional repressor [Clostridiales bacterium]|nr:transcriptional repressor [Clostridiales bacterium]
MSISINEIKKYLLRNDIKPSFPRLKVFEYLASHPTHPTVDDIYQSLVKEIPTLSKTTVYNTLDLFIRANIVRVVTIDGNELRYDVDITNHGHFKCEQCHTIYEFDIDTDVLSPSSLDGFDIREKNVYFKGTCPRCLAKPKSVSS